MYKLVVLLALVAVAVANPGFLGSSRSVVLTAPAPVVTYRAAPLVVRTAPVAYRTVAAPLAAPLAFKTYAAAPLPIAYAGGYGW